MNDSATGLDQTEEEILNYEVSDEILEATANTGDGKAGYTFGACTGLSVCPG